MSLIVPAQSSDLPECAELVAKISFFEPYFDHDQILRAMQGRPEAHTLLVERAEESGPIRGLIWFDPRGHLSRGGYLRLLAVDPEVQSQGIAGRLLTEAEQQVFAVSSAFFLMVNAKNAPARRFYLHRGYRELGRLPDYAVPEQDEVLMWKQSLKSQVE